VSSDDNGGDYIPTQIIAEMFKREGFAGIVYKSLLFEDGFNIALFNLDDASVVNCALYKAASISFDLDLMENGGDLTHASSNLGHGAGVKLPFKYLGIELTGDNAAPNAVMTLFTYESIGQDPPTEPPDPDNLLSSSQPKPMYYWAVASRKTAPDGVAQIIDATQSPVEGELGMGYEFNSDDSAGTRSDALYTFEGWLNNVITRTTLQALGVWDHRQMHLVDLRMMVGGRDLLYKLEHGYHGRALNANGPNTHYRDICVVDVVGPDSACDPTDPERKIEGTPLEKGFVYDREIWDKLVQGSRQKAQGHRESGVPGFDGERDHR